MSEAHAIRDALILQAIADGHSIDQILQQHPEITYLDIAAAAQAGLEALQRDLAAQKKPVKPKPARTCAAWTIEEEKELIELWDQDRHINEIAGQLQ